MAARQQEHEQQQVAQEEEGSGPQLIARLEECGISTGDIAKLRDAGFHTVEANLN